jgi:hypothetical protein
VLTCEEFDEITAGLRFLFSVRRVLAAFDVLLSLVSEAYLGG